MKIIHIKIFSHNIKPFWFLEISLFFSMLLL
nr:MAG TPA: hypothetical protein [Caudoviricetes sp.]